LKNAIKIRHSSPETLRTYRGWTRKFQAYTKSKDPRLLTTDGVKAFLTCLAVYQGVASSSQNQAFNALLFLFRHVLGKKFGKVKVLFTQTRVKRGQIYFFFPTSCEARSSEHKWMVIPDDC